VREKTAQGGGNKLPARGQGQGFRKDDRGKKGGQKKTLMGRFEKGTDKKRGGARGVGKKGQQHKQGDEVTLLEKWD